MPNPDRPGRVNKGIVLRIAIVATLVALAVNYGDFSKLTPHLNARLLFSMLAAQPVLLAAIAMMAIRFAMLARTPAVPFYLSFKAMLLSIGLNALLPGRLSELLKVSYLRDHAGVSTTSGMAALFLERLTDVVILGLLALASVSLLLLETAWVTLALMLAAIALLLILPRLERPLVALAQRLPALALRSIVERFFSHLSARLRDPLFYRSFLYGVAAWLLSWASVAVVVHMAGSIPIGLLGGLTVFIATTLGQAVPALPGGFGTYEAAAVIALKGFGYDFDQALALALALHVSQFLGTLGIALVIASTEKIGLATLLRQAIQFVRPLDR